MSVCAHLSMYMNVCIFECVCERVYYVFECVYVSMYICESVYLSVYVCVCVGVCGCACHSASVEGTGSLWLFPPWILGISSGHLAVIC